MLASKIKSVPQIVWSGPKSIELPKPSASIKTAESKRSSI